ncbi:MAG: histidinol phosphate phosphatase [Planctomycetes bacterium]|nr:histidinol phosphate phosphatase [Planctomycetota bacterium]
MAPAADRTTARAVAIEAAMAGGRAALRHFRRADLAVEWKADESPVTVADREAEAAIRDAVLSAFPDDGWIGEETGTTPGRSGRRWIVDPIDGTRNFVRGIPLWSTLVACEEDAPGGPRIIAACANFPALGECYDAMLGGGARCNGQRIAVSSVARLEDALFCYYTFEWFRRYKLEAVFRDLSARSAVQRGGGDAYMHLLVASGRAEIAVEPGLQVWDIAATSLIVSEAGGRVTTLDGRNDLRAGDALLSNGALHNEVVAVVLRLRE